MWKRDDAAKTAASSKEGQAVAITPTTSPKEGSDKQPASAEAPAKPPVPQAPEPPVRSVLMAALDAVFQELDSKHRRLNIRLNRLRSLPELPSPSGKRAREEQMARLTEFKELVGDTMKNVGMCLDLESVDYAISENGK